MFASQKFNWYSKKIIQATACVTDAHVRYIINKNLSENKLFLSHDNKITNKIKN